MRYVMAVVIALLVIALMVCDHFAHKSRKTIASRVTALIRALLLPVVGNLVIIVSSNRALSTVGYLTYFTGMNAVVYALLAFTFDYCRFPKPKTGIKRIVLGLLIFDAIQLLCNPILHHAFDLTAIEVNGADYFKLVPYMGQSFHRVLCYGVFMTSVVIFFWKMVTAPRLYFERYAVIFFSMFSIGLWETFYIFSSSPIDQSMIGFGFFGLLIYYFAIYYRPVRLLDKMLAQVASQMFQGIFFFDAVGRCVWVNEAGCENFHIDKDDFETAAAVVTGLFGDISGEEWARHNVIQHGDQRKYYALEKHSIRDSRGKTAGSFLSILDETEQQEALEKERYNATHDALTGLYSREYLFERIREAIDAEPDRIFMICFIDIADFKLVNDVFGREFGDYALQCTADSIRHSMKPGFLYGRLSGDTFGMCIPKEQFDAAIAESSLRRFTVRWDETEYHLVMHQGIYEAVERTLDVSVMFDRAHMALDSIKDKVSTHVAIYDDAMRRRVLWNQRISEELEQAIRERQIQPYLQAIVDCNGRVVGAEALVRWIHPTEGFLPPDRFIPILEKNGMIAQVDKYMWRCACELLSRWRDRDLFISINVSPKDFYFLDVVGELSRLVEEYDIDATRLRVEITETVMMSDEGKRISTLKALRAAGFIVEMDDFGSGYSSLNMLKDMPVDVVKIDMIFLRKAEDHARARTILTTIMQMTVNLKLSSITEGVETEEQYRALKGMGCGMFQGYYFAKPMAVEAFEAYLKEYR